MNDRGFTIIEVVIYIALFSLLMGSAFITAYQIIDGSQKLNTKTTTQEEGMFVVRKLTWAITGMDPAITPVVGGSLPCSQTLQVSKLNYPNNPIRFRRTGNLIEMSEAFGSYVPISTANVSATCLKFRLIPPLGTGPYGVSATSTLNNVDFAVTKYLRK